MPAHHPLIESDPKVMGGKPVVAGTRITVELILEKLAAGESTEQILEAHPRLTSVGIRAALAFAREAVRRVSNTADVRPIPIGNSNPREGWEEDARALAATNDERL